VKHLAGAATRALAALLGLAGLALMPEPVLAHIIQEQYEAPLPLVAYLAGAAIAVAMSFLFVMLRNPSARPETEPKVELRDVPLWLQRLLQAIGLIGWLWVALQALFGGSGSADVASLFLWVYGWVGVALVSAFFGPVWAWLDPFSTIHALLSGVASRLGISGGENAEYPDRIGRWPAVIGFVVILWLELVGRVEGGRSLGLFMLAYTFITVAAMSWFGRETWRRRGEVFSVWFELLNRLAPFGVAGEPEDGRVERRPFASALLTRSWTGADLVMVALGTGAIIYDGLSQTEPYFNLFIAQTPLGTGVMRDTITATVFLGLVVGIVLLTARTLSVRAVSAGLLPVAVGYLIAHYLTFLLVDGQRIILALNDPLVRGDNLLPGDLGFWEPTSFIPTSIVWSIQLAAVVGGHIVGAWAGHAALADSEGGAPIARQLPLAVLMVILTTVTLWSLGQAVIVPAEAGRLTIEAIAAR